MQNCPKCTGKKWLALLGENGIQKKEGNKRWWYCWRCKQEALDDGPYLPIAAPSILYIDIETSLSEVYNWDLRVPSKYISHENIINEWFIICWSASYLGQDKVFSGCVTQREALSKTDRNILQPLWDLMDSADIIAGHNLDAFDLKKIKTRFIINGLPPFKKSKTYDTLKMARKYKFLSNRLDYLGHILGADGKQDMDFDDWLDIQKTGNPKTLWKMLGYNIEDVKNGKAVLDIFLKWSDKRLDYGAKTFVNYEQKVKDDFDDLRSEIEDLL